MTEELIEASIIGASAELESEGADNKEEYYLELTVSSENTDSTEIQMSVSHGGYALIEVCGGELSGYRAANVVVDI